MSAAPPEESASYDLFCLQVPYCPDHPGSSEDLQGIHMHRLLTLMKSSARIL